MNYKLPQASILVRGALAVSAAVTTLVIAVLIDGLARHYASDRVQLVLEQTIVARF